MTDIKEEFDNLNMGISKLMSVDKMEQITPSWGSKGDFTTEDPFERVKFDRNRKKVILKYRINPSQREWIIDVARGLVHYYLPGEVQNFSTWNFSTMMALIYLPSSKISHSMNTQYRKNWLEFRSEFKKMGQRFDYLRMFMLLNSYKRSCRLDIFRSFIQELRIIDNKKTIEYNFNVFMHNTIQKFYQKEDITVIKYALKYQTMSGKELENIIGNLSSQQINKSLKRLAIQLKQHYFPIRSIIGLTRIYLEDVSAEQLEKVQGNPFYENTESFQNTDSYFTKIWLPITKISRVIQKYNQINQFSSQVLISLLDPIQVRISPEGYDTENEEWMSIFEHQSEIIPLELEDIIEVQDDELGNYRLSKEELMVLKQILQGGTIDPYKISVDLSQSKTKRIIRKLEKFAYQPIIMLRKPSYLNGAFIIFPLSDYTDLLEIPLELMKPELTHNFLEYLNLYCFGQYENSALDEIINYPWPYLSIEYCLQLVKTQNSLKFRKIAILRIIGISDDLIRFASSTKERTYIGIHKVHSGTIIKLPEEKYENGWIFDVDELLKN